MSTTTIAPAGTWTVDAAHSKVGFAVKHMGIATVRGEFTDFEGRIEIGDDLGSARAAGTVRAASIDTAEPGRDEHLRSADFFDAATHPEIAFEATSIRALGDGELEITGRLSIRGVTREETFRASILGTETDPWGNERIGLEVGGEISRAAYGIRFNQALGSGNALVGDRVRIALDISAVRQS